MDINISTDQHPEEMPTDQDLDKYLTEQYNYQAPRHGDIRTGIVVEISDQGVIMDVGFKREGLVPAEDLTNLDAETRSQVQTGASLPVFVIRPEDREGRPLLSIYQAHLCEDWLKAEKMLASSELYEGEIAGYNRGGLIVKFGKIRGFIPASQIVGLPKRMKEEQRHQRLAAMVGQHTGLKVIEVDRQRRRLIFSQRRAQRVWQELLRERVIGGLEEGETRHGKVTSITDFGAFVDLGGADGLIHVSELSWGRVDNPRQVLKIGDEVDAYVLNVDRERKRIALSLKKLQPDPWTLVDDRYQEEQLVEGRVTRVLDFGAFIELDLAVEGLLHAREMIGTPELNPADIVHSGETLLVKIIRIDSKRKRLDLSSRQVKQTEWERWIAEHQGAESDKTTEAPPTEAVEALATEAAEAPPTEAAEALATEAAEAPPTEAVEALATEAAEIQPAVPSDEGIVQPAELPAPEIVEAETTA
jgi:small subunit ribosomal protein S1